MPQLPATTGVVIVGAGPTGLTLATSLITQGTDVVLLDKLAEGANTSRAAVVHARTLEVLGDLGASGELVARGVIVPTFTVRDRDRTLMTISFEGLPTAHPYTLMVPQSTTERVLLDRLHALGGEVHRPYEVTALTQDDDGVTVTTSTGESVHAEYAVGADGMHSVVRELAGIGFSGDSYGQSFVLADVHMDWEPGRDEVQLFFSPAGLAVVAPLPEGRHRIVATVEEAAEHPDVADVQELLDARGPRHHPAHVREVVWSSRFRVHHRLADRYRAGRVLLAGDAAHVHSPAGGQGMNTGIQDAVDLARRLAAGDVAGYEAVRRPVAAGVVALTDRMTRLATVRRGRRLRNAALTTVGRVPALRRRLAMNLSELSVAR